MVLQKYADTFPHIKQGAALIKAGRNLSPFLPEMVSEWMGNANGFGEEEDRGTLQI